MGTNPVEILVVDDQKTFRRCVVDILEDEFGSKGARVLSASNGEEAVAVVRDGMLVFLDIEMPVMDGYGVLRHMEEHGIRPSKIVITGSNANNPAAKSLMEKNVGENYSHPEDIAYLPKPIILNDLIDTASAILGNIH